MLYGLYGPDGKPYQSERHDIHLLSLVWRGSNILVYDNREMINRLEFDDKRRIADTLRKIFEQDFKVLL